MPTAPITKKTPKETPEKETEQTLAQKLDAIAFKNEQAKKVAAIQAGKERLKDSLAKNRQRRIAGAPKLSGLGRLQGLK